MLLLQFLLLLLLLLSSSSSQRQQQHQHQRQQQQKGRLITTIITATTPTPTPTTVVTTTTTATSRTVTTTTATTTTIVRKVVEHSNHVKRAHTTLVRVVTKRRKAVQMLARVKASICNTISKEENDRNPMYRYDSSVAAGRLPSSLRGADWPFTS